MPPATDELYQTLKELMSFIQRGDGDGLRRCLERLDQQRDELGGDAPAMLRHYLDKRSYAKAVEFLESGDPESGRPRC